MENKLFKIVKLELDPQQPHRRVECVELEDGGQTRFGVIGLRERPASVGLPIEVPEPVQVVFVAERWHHRLGKALLVNVEHQSGDPSFDQAVYIHHNRMPKEYLNALLRSREARESIMELLAKGVSSVVVRQEGEEFAVRCIPPDLRVLFVQQEVKDAARVPMLARIASALPAVRALKLERRRSLGAQLVMALSGAAICSFIAAFLFSERWQIVDEAWSSPWVLGATGALLLCVPLLMVLRGGSRAFGHFVVCAALLWVTMPLASHAGLRAYNALADGQPAQVVRAKVVKRYSGGYVKHKGSDERTYLVALELEDSAQPVDLNVSEADYARLPDEGALTRVQIGQGALGWRWFVGVAP
jgi:uncharacterized membrane protein